MSLGAAAGSAAFSSADSEPFAASPDAASPQNTPSVEQNHDSLCLSSAKAGEAAPTATMRLLTAAAHVCVFVYLTIKSPSTLRVVFVCVPAIGHTPSRPRGRPSEVYDSHRYMPIKPRSHATLNCAGTLLTAIPTAFMTLLSLLNCGSFVANQG